MSGPELGELLGTFILILLGNGVVAGVLLAKSKAHGAGWIVITAGWAFAVLCGVLVSLAFRGPGSLNPAGIAAGWITGGMEADTALRLVGAQFAGAMLGAIVVWMHYLPHWQETEDQDLKRACFCTAPAIRSWPLNLFSEIVGTFVLVLVATAFGKTGEGTGMGPALVAALVWGIGLSLGGTTGYAINPARDLGPRLVHQLLPIAGKGHSDWGYALVPVLGPLIGGMAAALLMVRLLPSP